LGGYEVRLDGERAGAGEKRTKYCANYRTGGYEKGGEIWGSKDETGKEREQGGGEVRGYRNDCGGLPRTG